MSRHGYESLDDDHGGASPTGQGQQQQGQQQEGVSVREKGHEEGYQSGGDFRGAGGTTGKKTVSIEIRMSVAALFMFLIALACLGTLLVWFESDFLNKKVGGGSMGTEFFTLTLAVCMFALGYVPNYFVPPQHQGPVRRFGLMLYLWNIDALVCQTHGFMQWSSVQKDETTMIQTGRAGAVMVMLATFPAFLITFCTPAPAGGQQFRETARNALTMRGVVSIFSAVLLLVGQCLTWGIEDICSISTMWNIYNSQVVPLSISILLISTVLTDDKGTHDILFFFMVRYIVYAVPIFAPRPFGISQSNFNSIYRAEIAFIFLASVIYTFGLFFDRLRWFVAHRHQLRQQGHQDAAPNLKRSTMLLQVFFILLSIPAAVMVWSWSIHWVDANQNSRTANYLAALSLLIPFWNLIGIALSFPFLNMLSLVLAFHLTPLLAWLLSSNPTFTVANYYRAGVLLHLIVVTLSSLVALVTIPKTSVDQMFGDDANEARRTGPAGQDKRPAPVTMFMVWCLTCAYSWTEQTTIENGSFLFGFSLYPVVGLVAMLSFFSADNRDVQRLLYVQVMSLCTHTAMWPIEAQPTFSKVFFMLNGLMFVAFYSWDHPEEYLLCLHETGDIDVSLSISVTATADNNQKYREADNEQSLLSGGGGSPSGGGYQQQRNSPPAVHDRTPSTGGTFEEQ